MGYADSSSEMPQENIKDLEHFSLCAEI